MPDETLVVAVLDACVLYPPSLRDLFMRLASALAYEPRWTEEIHDEWIRNLLADRPHLSPAQLERTRRLMDQINEECLVIGYEPLVPTLTLPDPADRHVLAAAITAETRVIVTFNLSDFPAAVLAPLHVRAMHPDEYLTALFKDAPNLFLQAVREHRAALTRPAKTADAYLETLRANRLIEIAALLAERHSEL